MSSEMMMTAMPCAASSRRIEWMVNLGADVDADGGPVEDEDGGAWWRATGQDDLCWLPPDRVLTAFAGSGVTTSRRFTHFFSSSRMAFLSMNPRAW